MSLRRRSLVAAVAGVTLAGGLALALVQRRALAERWLEGYLGAGATLEVRELGVHGLALARIRAALPAQGVDALDIEEVRLGWTLPGLWRGELDRLAVRGVRARVTWPAPEAPGREAGAADVDGLAALALPSALALDDAELRVLVAGTEIAVQARASLARSAEGPIAGEGELTASGAAERARVKLRIDAASGSATGRLEVSAQVEPGTRLPLRGSVEGELALAADAQSLRLDVVGCPRVRIEQVSFAGAERLGAEIDTCLRAGDAPLLRATRGEPGVAIEAVLLTSPFELALRGGTASAAAAARIESALFRMLRAADGSTRWQASGEGSRVGLPGAGVELRGVRASGELDSQGRLRAELAQCEVRDLASPARFAPIDARVEAQRAPATSRIELALDARTRSGLALRALGHHDSAQQSGELVLAAETAMFSAAAVLAELPIAKRWLDGARGELGVTGRVAWSTAGAEVRTELRPRGLDLATPWGVYTGVDGAVALRGPDPWRTSRNAELRARRIRYGLEWRDARLRFALEPGGVLAVQELSGAVAGGRMQGAGTWRPAPGDSAFRVRVDGVDVQALLAHMELPGLVATGALQGTLPLVVRGGELEIRDGELLARNGVLQYRPAAGADDLSAQNPELRRTLDALRNVRYELLRVRMDGPVRGSPRIVVYVEGVSPTLGQGTPVQLTLNLDADLAALLRFPALRLPRR